MDLQARKIEFIQEFLKLQSEDVVLRLERFLKMEKEATFKPLSFEELNQRIDLTESDFINNKFKSNSELKTKYLK